MPELELEQMRERYVEQFKRLATHFSRETGSRREMVHTSIDIWLDAWNDLYTKRA